VTPPATAAPAVHRGRSIAPGRPLTTAPRPRRVSGPTRRRLPAPATRRPAQAEGGLALGLLAALRSLERNTLLDRLIRGRTWIALVAFALIGIVTLQLGLLKLNTGIGRALEHEAFLQRENAALSIENSELAAGERVESRAARLGMELVPVGALRFLAVHRSIDAARAAASLSTPVHASGAGSGEATAGASSTAASSTPPSTQPSTVAEQTATTTASVPSSSEAPATPPGEARTATGESTPPASTLPSASAAPSSTTPQVPTASAGAGEASPAGAAGGTQASPTG
jgi:cell division protein FtsL